MTGDEILVQAGAYADPAPRRRAIGRGPSSCAAADLGRASTCGSTARVGHAADRRSGAAGRAPRGRRSRPASRAYKRREATFGLTGLRRSAGRRDPGRARLPRGGRADHRALRDGRDRVSACARAMRARILAALEAAGTCAPRRRASSRRRACSSSPAIRGRSRARLPGPRVRAGGSPRSPAGPTRRRAYAELARARRSRSTPRSARLAGVRSSRRGRGRPIYAIGGVAVRGDDRDRPDTELRRRYRPMAIAAVHAGRDAHAQARPGGTRVEYNCDVSTAEIVPDAGR